MAQSLLEVRGGLAPLGDLGRSTEVTDQEAGREEGGKYKQERELCALQLAGCTATWIPDTEGRLREEVLSSCRWEQAGQWLLL